MRVDLRGEAEAAALRLKAGLPDAGSLRGAAIATWAGRMKNEHGSSRVFAALAEQMARAGMDGAECASFADEERRHGVLCGAVVEALGGRARFDLEPCPPLPVHADASPVVAVLRNVLHVGCLSETIAVALIGKERIEMPEGPLRDLLTEIWADEIGHARFGWTLVARCLPTLSAEDRAALARYVPVALAHVDAHELAHISGGGRRGAAPEGGERFGVCDANASRALYRATVSRVILPRLSAMGLA